MKVALFSGNYNYLREGANQALNILVRYLEDRAGARVRVYSPVTATPAFEPAGTLVAVPSVALPLRSEFRLALRLPRSIRDDVIRFQPDVVHVSTPDLLGWRAQSLAKEIGAPILASMHTRFETYLDYYRLGWARPALQAHLDRFYRRSDHVVAPTSALVDELKALRGDDRASVWSRGIDTALFAPERRDLAWRRAQGIGDAEVAVLFFGRLVREKGIGVFVEACRLLCQRGLPVRALVVGAGPAADVFAALPDVVLTGHLAGEELARAVASADLLLSPSTTETFGNVIVEAMASGLPVISADAQNARSILRDGQTGLLCSPADPVAYADAAQRLVRDPALRRAMGTAARQDAQGYSWDAASASVLAAYRSLLR